MQEEIEQDEFHPWDSEPEVGSFLKELIKLHGCKTVMEIGVFRGATSKKLIEAVAKGSYVGIDIEDNRTETTKSFFNQNEAWFIQNDSFTVLQSFIQENRKYDFAFIDSFHDYKQVSTEFAYCKKIINSGGLVCLHDSILHVGVRDFVAHLKSQGYNLITFNTPDIDGRGGSSGLTVVKM